MSERYTSEQLRQFMADAKDVVQKLAAAVHCIETDPRRYGLEDYLVDAALMADELQTAVFDAVFEMCPLCDGHDVLVDGKPSDCPACDGERSVTHGRAERIRDDLKDGNVETFDANVETQAVTRLSTIGGKEL